MCRYVQNIQLTFHQVLLALALIHCSYDGLTYAEQQEKWDQLRGRCKDYAARVIQTIARAKLAKQHLLKVVLRVTGEAGVTMSAGGKPMVAWTDFHSKHGRFSSYEDGNCATWVWLIEATRDSLIASMRTCFAVKASTRCDPSLFFM